MVLCGNETGCSYSGHQGLRNYWELPQKRQYKSYRRRFAGVIVGREGMCCLRWTTTRVASTLRSGSCRDTQVMHLLRLLHFVAPEMRFSYTSQHIPGSEDVLADAISRNLMSRLFSLQPHLAPNSESIPPELKNLLQDDHLDWTSETRRLRFLVCLTQVWRRVLQKPTEVSVF